MKWNKEIFIKESKKVHGDKYNYSKVEYINSRTKIQIKCLEHGFFEQLPSNHIRGYGCPRCAINNRTTKQKIFIKEAKKVHGDKYDYSKVEYVNNHVKVAIICQKHGIFLQEPQNHLRNHGCPNCMVNNHVLKNSFNKEIFIKEAKKVHGDKYDYSKVEYVQSTIKVCIICSKHGKFWQTYNSHIHQKSGCPSCKQSKNEILIENWLKSKNIKFIPQMKFNKCRGKKRPLPFDFYLPDYNTCIEYDGEQHFYPIDLSFGQLTKKEIKEKFQQTKLRDQIKNIFCKNNNIELIRISYKQNTKKELEKWLKEKTLN